MGAIQQATISYGSAAAPSTLLTGLVAFWKLEEASGTRVDEVGSNDLTDNNTVTQATGKVGNAAQFTAANSESLSIADNADVSMGAGVQFTIAGWFYLDNKSTYRHAWAKWESGVQFEYRLLYNVDTDKFEFWVSSDGSGFSTVTATSFGSPSTATWYFIMCRYDGTNISISVNDGTVNNTAFTADVFNGTQAFRLGSKTGGDYWDGRIDAVGLWKRALTTAEVTEFYNAGNGREHPFS